jgi:hypothetical protein
MAAKVTRALKNCFLSPASLWVYFVQKALGNEKAAMRVQMAHQKVLNGGEPA